MARNNYNIESIGGNSYKSIGVTIVVVLVILVLFYLLSVYIINRPDKVVISEATISYEQISAGSTFSMSDKKYLVVFYNRDNGGDITTAGTSKGFRIAIVNQGTASANAHDHTHAALRPD